MRRGDFFNDPRGPQYAGENECPACQSIGMNITSIADRRRKYLCVNLDCKSKPSWTNDAQGNKIRLDKGEF